MRRGNRSSDGFTRREAIGAIALAGGAALAGTWTAPARLAAAQRAAAGARPPVFPRGAIIRTLLKDYSPDALGSGPLLFHEHLSMRYPLNATEHFTDDVALMVDEARAAAKDGIACIVDGGHTDMARNLDNLKRIAAESGMPIVASGGYYMDRSYPPEIATKSADDIANDLVREAREQRYGAFGEIGQQGGELTEKERKVFQAIAKAQAQTGLPIFTHNPYTGMRQPPTPVPRDAALRQLDLLESAGAKAEQIAIGHVCCLDDPKAELAIQLAKRGVFVGFDRVTIPLVPDAQKVTTIMAMAEAGYADHLLLASDFSNARGLKKNGGAGLGQAAVTFGPMLVKAGMSEAMLHDVLVNNSRRFLAFVPVKA